jgi:hypothetical protein
MFKSRALNASATRSPYENGACVSLRAQAVDSIALSERGAIKVYRPIRAVTPSLVTFAVVAPCKSAPCRLAISP